MSEDKQKIKIIEPGMIHYTGPVGMVSFVDGVSVEPVDKLARNFVGAIFRCELADKPGYQVGSAADEIRGNHVKFDDPNVKVFNNATFDMKNSVPNIKKPNYTREELEQIADELGLNGVRDIAKIWSVTGRSIQQVIDAILNAQGGKIESVEEGPQGDVTSVEVPTGIMEQSMQEQSHTGE